MVHWRKIPRHSRPFVGGLANPFELAFGFYFILAGIDLWFIRTPTTTMEALVTILPSSVFTLWGLSITLGGFLILGGVLGPQADPMARAFERAGLLLVVTAWGTLALTVFVATPEQWVVALKVGLVTAACAMRMYAVVRVERAIDRIREEGEG